ncbi:hypothetical protein [Lentzea sp. NPDC055074]
MANGSPLSTMVSGDRGGTSEHRRPVLCHHHARHGGRPDRSSPDAFIDDYGTTLTDAAREARLLEERAPDRHCTHDRVRAISGGYEVKASCSKPTVFFSGVGGTVTQAVENARLSSGI